MKKAMTTMRTQKTPPRSPEGFEKTEPVNKIEPESLEPAGLEMVEKPNREVRAADVDLRVPSDKARNLRGVSAKDGTTKAKIERAALHLFAENGIDGVSTKQIAAAAGISEGAIYRHFSGKEELARTLMLAIHIRLTELILVADESHEALENKIKFIVTHYCRIADEDWDLFQYHILHIHHFPRLSDSPLDSPMGAAAALLQKAMDEGEIEPVDPYILAAMSLGVVLQAAQAKVFGYVKGPLSARTDLFTRRVLGVLQAA